MKFFRITTAIFLVFSRPLAAETEWDNSALAERAGADAAYTFDEAYPGLTFRRPLCLRSIPGSEPEQLLVVELAGRLSTFEAREDVLDNPELITWSRGTQTYAACFHPNYPKPPWLYVLLNDGKRGSRSNRVVRVDLHLNPLRIDPISRYELLSWASEGHNGGDILFGPDGMLYISSGDGQKPGDPARTGQATDNLRGSILRIDVRQTPYAIPVDNPFVGIHGVRPEIWCYGHRNPWKMNFDKSGNLWVGDNGEEQWENLYHCKPGDNHGWSTYEGNSPYRLHHPLAGPSRELARPMVTHSHREMRSIVGGLECRDPQLPELTGQILYGDYVTGGVRGLQIQEEKDVQSKLLAELRAPLLAFGETRAGRMRLLLNDGRIVRLVPNRMRKKPFPNRLTQTGLYADLRQQQTAPGVQSYTINHPQWLDGLTARRYLALPPYSIIKPDARLSKGWEIPDGAAAFQTLETRDGKPVETQLILRQNQIYYFYSFAWNETGDEADLVPPEGAEIRGRRFMSRSDCAVCHTAHSNFLLGFNEPQLNRGGQLRQWRERGWLRPTKYGAPENLPRWPGREMVRIESAKLLEARARTYLHVNCAHCHRESGAGGRGDFQLLITLTREACNLEQIPRLDLWQIEDSKLLVPGSPDRSMLLKRMSVRGPGQMPLIGSNQLDEQGIALIRKWIQSLPAAGSKRSGK